MQYNAGKRKLNTEWTYTDDLGSFEWKNPHTMNQLYFPVCNEAGMMASVTPTLHGDATTGQHTFLRLPLVIQDLHNTRSARNFWIYNDILGAYSLTGNSARQASTLFTAGDSVDITIKGTFLSHTLVREDQDAGIRSEITSFAPVTDDAVEIMWVKVTNISRQAMEITPTAAMPIYGRSADSLRDHNHWTSLAHRMELNEYGQSVKPAIIHDERGHKPNDAIYFVLAAEENGEKPVGQFPTVNEFIGEGGSLEWPEAVVRNIKPYEVPPNRRDGMEAVGAIRFDKVSLSPGQTVGYIVIEGVTYDRDSVLRCIERYGSGKKVEAALKANNAYWRERIERITFETADKSLGKWMHWVALQPILRKIYGNSFLPHFDYGRGGRGWRDLWQDSLALLLQNPAEMKDTLSSSFEGVRLDGSNATIIEKGIGKFAADRNRISRVWMDHGIWPYYTTRLYADQTGDIDIFFTELPYWKDHQIKRAKARDHGWDPSHGTRQKGKSGEIFRGTLLEHVLVQHLTCFHNVGGHNNMKLEDADWNDLLDMANEKGESVPFSAFYGWNMITIAGFLEHCRNVKGMENISLFRELVVLTGLAGKVDYQSPQEKRERLSKYFESIGDFSGQKVEVPTEQLAKNLAEMGEWVLEHVRKQEWIESKTGHGFFNGYYNNDGNRVDGDHEDCTRMNLTAQTFAIMSGAATDGQIRQSFQAVKAILKDPNTGGLRLTTPLGPNTLNFGRGYAVVYGEKETGGTFNHMVVMFMNALYRRGCIEEAYEVFRTLYANPNNTKKAKIYPGIPEYISHEGRGMYHYLSGSASWLLMTVLTEMFGVKGRYGDLLLTPRLVREQFTDEGTAGTNAFFLGRRLKIIYCNPDRLEYDKYRIMDIKLNGSDIVFEQTDSRTAKLLKADLERSLKQESNVLEVILGS